VSIDPDGNRRGGIALVAWSLAHTPPVGFLAHADALPADARRALEPCLEHIASLVSASHPTPSQLTLARFNLTQFVPALSRMRNIVYGCDGHDDGWDREEEKRAE